MTSQLNKAIPVTTILMLFGCVSLPGGNTSNNVAYSGGHGQRIKSDPAHDSIIRRIEQVELYDLFNNRIHRGVTPNGRNWTMNFQAPNQAFINWTNRLEVGQDTGTWRIEDENICIKWKQMYNNNEYCMEAYYVSEDQYNLFHENGQMYSHMIVD